MNIILAVNDRALEKHITALPGINVLTTIKRREQVVDNVLSFNPATVVLSSSLLGGLEFRELIDTLRKVRPELKIVFIYGNKDDEYKSFIDFLIRREVYDIVHDEIDEETIHRALFVNATLGEMKFYLLDKESVSDIAAPAPRIPGAKKEPPKLEVLIVEKIIERSIIETKYLGNIIVGVGGLFPRSGCTYTAIKLGQALGALKCDVGVCISPKTLQAIAEYSLTENTAKIELWGCQMYSDMSLAKSNHKIVISDIGNVYPGRVEEFYLCDEKFLLCPCAPWEIDTLTEFLSDNSFASQIRYLFCPITDNGFKEIEQNMKKGNCNAYKLPYNPNIETLSREQGKFFKELLKPLMNNFTAAQK